MKISDQRCRFAGIFSRLACFVVGSEKGPGARGPELRARRGMKDAE